MPTVDGIVSGLDTTSLINAVLAASQVSIQTLQQRQLDYESQKEAVAGVKNRLVTLSDAVKAMDTPEEFAAYTATTTSDLFTVTADTSAVAGSHSVRVDQLAVSEIQVSDGFDDRSAGVLSSGSFDVTVGGVTTTLTLGPPNASLDDLVDTLNTVDGLSAYVLDTGAATGRYKLVVQGDDTGAANAISFDFSGLSGGITPTMTQTRAATDAIVQIDGVQVQSASNSIDGAIAGVTLDLLKTGATAGDVTVSRDTEAMRQKLQDVVDAYNAVIDYYGQQTVFNSEQGLKGPLVGESTTRRALADLSELVTTRGTVSGTTLSSLSELGVLTQQDGHLEFDTTAFDDAFAADPESVTTFLTGSTGPLVSLAARIDDVYVDEDTGSLASRIDGLQDTITDVEEQVTKAQERMTNQANLLRAKFDAMEIALARIQSSQGYITALLGSGASSSSSSTK